MKKINNFNVDISDLPAVALSRQYIVTGEKDAEFILQVFNSSQQFYDFKSSSFSAAFTSTSSLSIKMKSNSYIGSINLPANGSGDTYTVLLLTPPDKDTILDFGESENSYSTTITQLANSTLTFTPVTDSDSSYESMPTSVTSTSSPIPKPVITKSVDWDVTNKDNDANGFGLRLIRQPIDTDWYSTTTETVNQAILGQSDVEEEVSSATSVVVEDSVRDTIGLEHGDYVFGTDVAAGTNVHGVDGGTFELSAASSISAGVTLYFVRASNEWIVDDLTDIATGMVITAVSGTNAYLNGTPTVIDINRDTNTITLSEVPHVSGNDTGKQGFYDNITLAFQARGSSAIQKITGANIDFSGWNADVTSATSAPLTKTVRSDSDSSTTITLNGTRGISGGNFVTISGLGLVNTSTNFVVTNRTSSGDATASEAGGEIITTLAQANLTVGSTLYFTGSTKTVTLANEIKIISHPLVNKTIYLNLDNFITVGVNTA